MRKVHRLRLFLHTHSAIITMVGMATLPNINTTFRTTYTYSISSLWVQTTLTSWSVVKNNTSIATDLKKARAGIPIRKNPMTPNCANRQLMQPEIHWSLTSAVWITPCWTVTCLPLPCVGMARHVSPKTTAGVHSRHWHWDGRLKKKTSWKM